MDPCGTGPPGLRYVPTRYENRLMPASAPASVPAATPESPDVPAGVGRPRDPRIDDAVLQATTDPLREGGDPPPPRRRHRRAGRHHQARHLPALADEGAAGPRGGLPDRGAGRGLPGRR